MANNVTFDDDEHPVGDEHLIAPEIAGRNVAGWRTASDNSELHSNSSRRDDGSGLDAFDQVPWP